MSKKKVLIISPGLPYPPVDGHKLKLYNLALQLTEKVDLHLIVISNEKVNTECEIFLNQTFSSYKIFRFSKIFYILNSSSKIVKTSFIFCRSNTLIFAILYLQTF